MVELQDEATSQSLNQMWPRGKDLGVGDRFEFWVVFNTEQGLGQGL